MFTKEKTIPLELQVEENVSYWNKLVLFFFTKENIFFCSKLCKVRLFTFSQKVKYSNIFKYSVKKAITQMGCK